MTENEVSLSYNKERIELLQASKCILIENRISTIQKGQNRASLVIKTILIESEVSAMHRKGRTELRYASETILIESKISGMHRKGN